MRPEHILAVLLNKPPSTLDELPKERGMYLFDHTSEARYIGTTAMGIRRRVADYHVGGDGNSHKFSTVYNAGRMFRTRNDVCSNSDDGRIAKKLIRCFPRAYCGAVGVPLPSLGKGALFAVEAEVSRIAPANAEVK